MSFSPYDLEQLHRRHQHYSVGEKALIARLAKYANDITKQLVEVEAKLATVEADVLKVFDDWRVKLAQDGETRFSHPDGLRFTRMVHERFGQVQVPHA